MKIYCYVDPDWKYPNKSMALQYILARIRKWCSIQNLSRINCRSWKGEFSIFLDRFFAFRLIDAKLKIFFLFIYFHSRRVNKFIIIFLILLLVLTFFCFGMSNAYTSIYTKNWYMDGTEPKYFYVNWKKFNCVLGFLFAISFCFPTQIQVKYGPLLFHSNCILCNFIELSHSAFLICNNRWVTLSTSSCSLVI